MTRGKAALGGALALLFALGLSWLSRAPTSYAHQDDALLRLSWRVPGVMVEECRLRSEEELAALAPHMRTPEICTGLGADYELVVALDGAETTRDTLRPAGARRDRPVYVFHELELEPGTYRLDVAFRALVPPGFGSSDQPLELAWAGDVAPGPTDIVLLSLDPSGRALVVRDP